MKDSVVLLLLLGALCACGDDDGGGGSPDATTVEGGADLGRDLGPRDMGPDVTIREMGPRPDVPVPPPPNPMRDCSPADDACAEGEKCALVIEQTDSGEDLFYTRCAPDGSRSGGARCSFSVDVPGAPNVIADTCERGFFCGTDAEHRFPTCLPYCASGSACSTGQLCSALVDGVAAAACLAYDRCDPVYQVGCPVGEGCYVVADDVRSATTCATFNSEGGGDGSFGDTCTFVNNCAVGLTCAADVGPDGRPAMTRHCRPYCDTSMGGRGGGGDGGLPDAASDAAADGGAVDASSGADASSDAGEPADEDGSIDADAPDADDADAATADAAPSDAGPAADAGSPFTGRCPEGVGICLPFILGIAEEPPMPIGVCRE